MGVAPSEAEAHSGTFLKTVIGSGLCIHKSSQKLLAAPPVYLSGAFEGRDTT